MNSIRWLVNKLRFPGLSLAYAGITVSLIVYAFYSQFYVPIEERPRFNEELCAHIVAAATASKCDVILDKIAFRCPRQKDPDKKIILRIDECGPPALRGRLTEFHALAAAEWEAERDRRIKAGRDVSRLPRDFKLNVNTQPQAAAAPLPEDIIKNDQWDRDADKPK